MFDLLAVTLLCTGLAPTSPPSNIEVEVRPASVKYSTIRYEFGGTAYVQSIGYMHGAREGSSFVFGSGTGPNATVLKIVAHGDHIASARFTHYISGMNDSPVECSIEESADGHRH